MASATCPWQLRGCHTGGFCRAGERHRPYSGNWRQECVALVDRSCRCRRRSGLYRGYVDSGRTTQDVAVGEESLTIWVSPIIPCIFLPSRAWTTLRPPTFPWGYYRSHTRRRAWSGGCIGPRRRSGRRRGNAYVDRSWGPGFLSCRN